MTPIGLVIKTKIQELKIMMKLKINLDQRMQIIQIILKMACYRGGGSLVL